jgi:hypothetical protein
VKLIHAYRFWLLRARLCYYETALAHLTYTDACHPDIPGIVHKINELEGELR